MAVFLTNEDVEGLISLDECIEVLENMYQQQADGLVEVLPRRRFNFPNGKSQLLMGGSVLGSGVYGIRSRNVSLLFDTATLEVIAAIEPSALARMRTGATTALAAKYMAAVDASTVGIIGTGHQAAIQLRALSLVRPIVRVRAYSRSRENRTAFAQKMAGELGIEVVAARSPEECVRGADILVTATTSSQPVLDGSWLKPGVHISAMGSNSWARRELDQAAVERADLIVVDSIEQARTECGDLIWAAEPAIVPGAGYDSREPSTFRWWDVIELHAIVSGKVPGRPFEAAITLFETQGIGVADVACYSRLASNARVAGVGEPLPF